MLACYQIVSHRPCCRAQSCIETHRHAYAALPAMANFTFVWNSANFCERCIDGLTQIFTSQLLSLATTYCPVSWWHIYIYISMQFVPLCMLHMPASHIIYGWRRLHWQKVPTIYARLCIFNKGLSQWCARVKIYRQSIKNLGPKYLCVCRKNILCRLYKYISV